jgi:predicted Zn finger-like uncharacterized protein
MTNWATRCNACGTSFRISEEQLKISDGFVRCGRCDAVFDARGSLFDLDAVSAPMPLASAPMPLQPAMAPAASPVAFPAAHEPAEFIEPSWQETAPAASSASAPADIGVPSDDWRSAPDPSRAEPVWTDAPVPPTTEDEANSRLRELLRAEPEPTAPVEPAVFASLQAASKLAPRAGSRRWNAFGGLLAGLLALALPLQWAWIEREALRARLPQLDTLLDKQGLASEGWRQLEGLSVGGSSLQATPQGGAYRLELVLHNRAPHRVAMPWLDLRLSDAAGSPLMRRAIAPAELGAPEVLQAGEQRKLQAVFRLQGGVAAVNGYEIGLFHP